MRRVNYWHIANILFPLWTVDEEERVRILRIDENDGNSMRSIFRRHLLPVHKKRPQEIQMMVKDTLRYFLTRREPPLDSMLASLQDSPIGVPNDPYDILLWLWDVFFPGESYYVADITGYVEDNDLGTGNEVCGPVGGWPSSGNVE